jgi:hypothetical protein
VLFRAANGFGLKPLCDIFVRTDRIESECHFAVRLQFLTMMRNMVFSAVDCRRSDACHSHHWSKDLSPRGAWRPERHATRAAPDQSTQLMLFVNLAISIASSLFLRLSHSAQNPIEIHGASAGDLPDPPSPGLKYNTGLWIPMLTIAESPVALRGLSLIYRIAVCKHSVFTPMPGADCSVNSSSNSVANVEKYHFQTATQAAVVVRDKSKATFTTCQFERSTACPAFVRVKSFTTCQIRHCRFQEAE